MTVPSALYGEVKTSLKTCYPAVQLSEQWLGECLAYILEELRETRTQRVVEIVKEQFLLADLASSLDRKSPYLLPRRDHAPREKEEVLARDMVLQVTGLMDISRPAMVLWDELQGERADDTVIRRKRGRGGGEGEKPKARPVYRMTLSDGDKTVEAVELEPILPPLDRVECIGVKLMLSRPAISAGGILLLDTSNASCLGGRVEELVESAQIRYRQTLMTRLGRPVETEPTNHRPRVAQAIETIELD